MPRRSFPLCCTASSLPCVLSAAGAFDPLNLASDDSERTQKLREAEIKHARLAMVSFLGYTVQVGSWAGAMLLLNVAHVSVFFK